MNKRGRNDPFDHGVEVTADGWIVTDISGFRLLADQAPPRSSCFLHLLKDDAHEWKVVAFWIVGGGLLVWACVTQEWSLVLPGVIVLSLWVRMFRAALQDLRDCPLIIGVIEALGPPPHLLLHDHSITCAQLPDGRALQVALPTRLGRACLHEHGRAEVLILYNPKLLYSFVIGARPIPPCSARGAESTPEWVEQEG